MMKVGPISERIRREPERRRGVESLEFLPSWGRCSPSGYVTLGFIETEKDAHGEERWGTARKRKVLEKGGEREPKKTEREIPSCKKEGVCSSKNPTQHEETMRRR